ncbi:menaquinone biosynthetic enzyme MqnA/MqnD family protein [Olivibacter sitiensis]|uniref:menaquinone biosynthetic enzyme MqnA/MqnD family protein n=1 Tax=Olivibacter sitiensis TaxID=376470 RepID=UPI0003FF3604|nr:menaquinone biosynthesis protein [Olivibacter sitiensis]
MDKVRISAVSYTNSKPFIYGLEHGGVQDMINLVLDVPSTCARKLINNEVDLGLVPVAALLDMSSHDIIGDYCIGASGAVNSVFIFSNKPIEQINTIRLDKQSRTSNNLAMVLLTFHWKKEVSFAKEDEPADAFVLIGDRTFGKAKEYSYAYDLAECWMNFVGLPFAFAVWASNKVLPPAFIHRFNEAMSFGLKHRKEVIAQLPKRSDFDIAHYLMYSIDFDLDENKRKAISLFHNYMIQLSEQHITHPYLQKTEQVI